MKRVRRHAVRVDVRVELGVRPVHERVELDQPGHAVAFEAGEGGAVVALRSAKPRHPDRGAFQRPLQRINLADFAAGLAGFDALENRRHALLVHEFLQCRRVGEVGGQSHVAVLRPRAVDEVVRLRKEPPGVQRDEPNRQVVAGDQVRQRLVFEPQRRGEYDLFRVPLAELLKACDSVRAGEKGQGGHTPKVHENS